MRLYRISPARYVTFVLVVPVVIVASSVFVLVVLYQLYMFVTTFGPFLNAETDPIENVSRCAFLLIIFNCFFFFCSPSSSPSLALFFVSSGAN